MATVHLTIKDIGTDGDVLTEVVTEGDEDGDTPARAILCFLMEHMSALADEGSERVH